MAILINRYMLNQCEAQICHLNKVAIEFLDTGKLIIIGDKKNSLDILKQAEMHFSLHEWNNQLIAKKICCLIYNNFACFYKQCAIK